MYMGEDGGAHVSNLEHIILKTSINTPLIQKYNYVFLITFWKYIQN